MDAAGSACSAALWQEGAVAARRLELMRRGQSERLVPMIQEVMAEAGIGYETLDVIAVTVGPGGFTGVRIGLATARGLALACGAPLVGASNFLVLAAAARAEAPPEASLAVLIDGKRRELYLQAFDASLAPLAEPASLAPEDLADALPAGPLVLAGDAVAQAAPALEARGRDFAVARASGASDAAHLAELVAGDPERFFGDSRPPQPLYLRPPDVTPPHGGADPPS